MSLSKPAHESALLAALNRAFIAAKRDCRASPNTARDGGIVIDYMAHIRGVWIWNSDAFAFTRGGYVEPSITVPTIDAAVRYTLDYVCKA
jgi:hypothetical protein